MCQGEAPVIIFHQVAFAADYQRSEFSLLGMAIKYAMILVLTPEAAVSQWVQTECLAFLEGGKRVIPYAADPGVKAKLTDYLASVHYVDGTAPDGFLKLVKQLRSVLDAAIGRAAPV